MTRVHGDTVSNGSCSSTSWTYSTLSGRPSYRHLLTGHGVKIDRLLKKEHVSHKESQLLAKLVKTKAYYEQLRNQLLSSSLSISNRDAKNHPELRNDREKTAMNDIVTLVDLVDKTTLLKSKKKLGPCCSCSNCISKRSYRKKPIERTEFKRCKVKGAGGFISNSSIISKNKIDPEIRLRIKSITKNIKSDPCTCSFKCSEKVQQQNIQKTKVIPTEETTKLRTKNIDKLHKISCTTSTHQDNVDESKDNNENNLYQGHQKRQCTIGKEKIQNEHVNDSSDKAILVKPCPCLCHAKFFDDLCPCMFYSNLIRDSKEYSESRETPYLPNNKTHDEMITSDMKNHNIGKNYKDTVRQNQCICAKTRSIRSYTDNNNTNENNIIFDATNYTSSFYANSISKKHFKLQSKSTQVHDHVSEIRTSNLPRPQKGYRLNDNTKYNSIQKRTNQKLKQGRPHYEKNECRTLGPYKTKLTELRRKLLPSFFDIIKNSTSKQSSICNQTPFVLPPRRMHTKKTNVACQRNNKKCSNESIYSSHVVQDKGSLIKRMSKLSASLSAHSLCKCLYTLKKTNLAFKTGKPKNVSKRTVMPFCRAFNTSKSSVNVSISTNSIVIQSKNEDVGALPLLIKPYKEILCKSGVNNFKSHSKTSTDTRKNKDTASLTSQSVQLRKCKKIPYSLITYQSDVAIQSDKRQETNNKSQTEFKKTRHCLSRIQITKSSNRHKNNNYNQGRCSCTLQFCKKGKNKTKGIFLNKRNKNRTSERKKNLINSAKVQPHECECCRKQKNNIMPQHSGKAMPLDINNIRKLEYPYRRNKLDLRCQEGDAGHLGYLKKYLNSSNQSVLILSEEQDVLHDPRYNLKFSNYLLSRQKKLINNRDLDININKLKSRPRTNLIQHNYLCQSTVTKHVYAISKVDIPDTYSKHQLIKKIEKKIGSSTSQRNMDKQSSFRAISLKLMKMFVYKNKSKLCQISSADLSLFNVTPIETEQSKSKTFQFQRHQQSVLSNVINSDSILYPTQNLNLVPANHRLTGVASLLKRCLYIMNVQVTGQRKPLKMIHNLKHQEYEPTTCVPGKCDPEECTEKITKQLFSKNNLKSKYKNGFRYRNRNAKGHVVKTNTTGLTYQSLPRPARRTLKSKVNLKKMGSSLSFQVSFSKNKTSHVQDTKPKRHTKYSKTSVKRYKKKSTKTKRHKESQSTLRNKLIHKASTANPTKCGFCTLKLQKKGRHHAHKIAVKTGDRGVNLQNVGTSTPAKLDNAIHRTAEKYQTTIPKKNIKQLLSYECDPDICVPGYECYELTKHRNIHSVGTDPMAMRKIEVRSKSVMSVDRPNSRPHKNNVQLGSRFSLNIAIQRDRSVESRSSNNAPKKNKPEQLKKTAIKHSIAQHSNCSCTKKSQTDIPTSFLKRCFCTAKMQGLKGNTPPKILHKTVCTMTEKVKEGRIENKNPYVTTGMVTDKVALPRKLRGIKVNKTSRRFRLFVEPNELVRIPGKLTRRNKNPNKVKEKGKKGFNLKSSIAASSQKSKARVALFIFKPTDGIIKSSDTKDDYDSEDPMLAIRIKSSISLDLEFYKNQHYPCHTKVQAAAEAVKARRNKSQKDINKTDKSLGPMNIKNLHRGTVTPFSKPVKHLHDRNVLTAYKFKTFPYKLAPNECEPGVCEPGECNPYECLKLINRRNRSDEGSSTDISTTRSISNMAKPHRRYRDNHAQHVSRRIQPKRDRDAEARKSRTIVYEDPKTGSSNSSKSRQAVKIGSDFSFKVEFFKDRSLSKGAASAKPQPTSYIKPTTYREPKRPIHRHEQIKFEKPRRTRSGPRRTVSSLTRSNSISSKQKRTQHRKAIRHTDSQVSRHKMRSTKTGVGTFLKRCFCTLKLQKRPREMGRNFEVQQDNQSLSIGTETMKTNLGLLSVDKGTNTKGKHKHHVQRLDPNECEPGFCIPYQCDPYECLERIKKRRTHVKQSGARPYKTHSVSTLTNEDKSLSAMTQANERPKRHRTRSISSSAVESKYKKHKKPREHKPHKKTRLPKERYTQKQANYDIGPSANSQRQAVRIGSSFSFNIEFYKDRKNQEASNAFVVEDYPKTVKHIKRDKHFRKHTARTGGGTRPMKTKSMSSSYRELRLYNRSMQSQASTESRGSGGPALKRCFCTLKLQKIGTKQKGSEIGSFYQHSGTITSYQPEKISVFGREVGTGPRRHHRNLKPYECEPGVCIPGECDPYECLKRMNRRIMKHSGTDTPRMGTRSMSSFTHRPGGTYSISTRTYKDRGDTKKEHHAGSKYRMKQPHTRQIEAVKKSPPRPSRALENISINNRQVVRLGSSFSFNVEFFKDRSHVEAGKAVNGAEVGRKFFTAEAKRGKGIVKDSKICRPSICKEPTCHRTKCKTSSCGSKCPVKNKGTVGQGISRYHRKSQSRSARTESTGSSIGPMLKRCFCTLTLQRAEVKTIMNIARTAPLKDKMTLTKEKYLKPPYQLEPDECEPGFCVSGECDVQKCLETMKKRTEVKTTTNKARTVTLKDKITLTKDKYFKEPLNQLEPGECAPGFCVPGKCDPQKCLERMKKRLIQRAPRTSGSKRSRDFTTKQTQDKVKEEQKRIVEEPRFKLPASLDRQSIGFRSNFSFTVGFYRETMLPDSSPKDNKAISSIKGKNNRQLKDTKVAEPIPTKLKTNQDRKIQVNHGQTKDKSTIAKKQLRCFCTKFLLNMDKRKKTVATETNVKCVIKEEHKKSDQKKNHKDKKESEVLLKPSNKAKTLFQKYEKRQSINEFIKCLCHTVGRVEIGRQNSKSENKASIKAMHQNARNSEDYTQRGVKENTTLTNKPVKKSKQSAFKKVLHEMRDSKDFFLQRDVKVNIISSTEKVDKKAKHQPSIKILRNVHNSNDGAQREDKENIFGRKHKADNKYQPSIMEKVHDRRKSKDVGVQNNVTEDIIDRIFKADKKSKHRPSLKELVRSTRNSNDFGIQSVVKENQVISTDKKLISSKPTLVECLCYHKPSKAKLEQKNKSISSTISAKTKTKGSSKDVPKGKVIQTICSHYKDPRLTSVKTRNKRLSAEMPAKCFCTKHLLDTKTGYRGSKNRSLEKYWVQYQIQHLILDHRVGDTDKIKFLNSKLRNNYSNETETIMRYNPSKYHMTESRQEICFTSADNEKSHYTCSLENLCSNNDICNKQRYSKKSLGNMYKEHKFNTNKIRNRYLEATTNKILKNKQSCVSSRPNFIKIMKTCLHAFSTIKRKKHQPSDIVNYPKSKCPTNFFVTHFGLYQNKKGKDTCTQFRKDHLIKIATNINSTSYLSENTQNQKYLNVSKQLNLYKKAHHSGDYKKQSIVASSKNGEYVINFTSNATDLKEHLFIQNISKNCRKCCACLVCDKKCMSVSKGSIINNVSCPCLSCLKHAPIQKLEKYCNMSCRCFVRNNNYDLSSKIKKYPNVSKIKIGSNMSLRRHSKVRNRFVYTKKYSRFPLRKQTKLHSQRKCCHIVKLNTCSSKFYEPKTSSRNISDGKYLETNNIKYTKSKNSEVKLKAKCKIISKSKKENVTKGRQSITTIRKLGIGTLKKVVKSSYKTMLHPNRAYRLYTSKKRELGFVCANFGRSTSKPAESKTAVFKELSNKVPVVIETYENKKGLCYLKRTNKVAKEMHRKSINKRKEPGCKNSHIAALRDRPYLWAYFMWPWLYSRCASVITIRNFNI